MNNKNDIQFTEKNVIGFFAKKTDNWCLRLCETEVIKNNEVINNYFDLRNVKLDENNNVVMYGKGITLTNEELKSLKELLNEYSI